MSDDLVRRLVDRRGRTPDPAGGRSRSRPRPSTASPRMRPTPPPSPESMKPSGGPSFNPLIVHVPTLPPKRIGGFRCRGQSAGRAFLARPAHAGAAADADATIASIVTAGLPTIALRVPAHPAMQALAARPSAVRSPRLPPTPAGGSARPAPSMCWPAWAAASR